mgnify:CR=1 FL=1
MEPSGSNPALAHECGRESRTPIALPPHCGVRGAVGAARFDRSSKPPVPIQNCFVAHCLFRECRPCAVGMHLHRSNMAFKIRCCLVYASIVWITALPEPEQIKASMADLDVWTETAFLRLPCFERAEWGRGHSRTVELGPFSAPAQDAFRHTLATWDSISELLEEAAAQQLQMMRSFGWFDDQLLPRGLNHSAVAAKLTDLTDQSNVKLPFVQRVQLPVNATVFVWGDLHGSLHPFLRHLGMLRRLGALDAQWRLAPQVHLLFLGDYVDRGPYGVEVIATALRLKVSNPGRVWMVRGNHEDAALNAQSTFAPEMAGKYPHVPVQHRNKVFAWYHSLPQAIFLGQSGEAAGAGSKWVLACHGGIEPGYDPAPLLQARSEHNQNNADDATWLQRVRAEGVHSLFALVPGLLRAAWVRSLPQQLQEGIGQSLRNMMLKPHNSFGPLSASWALPEDAPGLDQWPGPPTAIGHVAADGAATSHNTLYHVPFSSTLNDTQRLQLLAAEQEAAQAGAGLGYWPAAPMATGAFPVGFLWNDFYVDDTDIVMGYNRGRGLILGQPVTAHWLWSNGVSGILRGHQHNNAPPAGPMLSRLKKHKGVYDNWHGAGMVYTFLSAAETAVLGYDSASVGVLRLGGALAGDAALFAGSSQACTEGQRSDPLEPPNEYSMGQLPSGWRLWQCQSDVPAQRVQFQGGWKRATRPMADAPTGHEIQSAISGIGSGAQATCLDGRLWQSVWWHPVLESAQDADAGHACEMMPLPDAIPANGWSDASSWLPALQCDLMRG